MTTEKEKAKLVATAMIKSGSGGFAKHLGTRLAQMNLEEIIEFKKSWPSLWVRYSKIAKVE